MEEESLPWNYKDIVKSYLKPEYKLLDMGTGGGEFLLSLNHPYENTLVTEAWIPNVKLCQEKNIKAKRLIYFATGWRQKQ